MYLQENFGDSTFEYLMDVPDNAEMSYSNVAGYQEMESSAIEGDLSTFEMKTVLPESAIPLFNPEYYNEDVANAPFQSVLAPNHLLQFIFLWNVFIGKLW